MHTGEHAIGRLLPPPVEVDPGVAPSSPPDRDFDAEPGGIVTRDSLTAEASTDRARIWRRRLGFASVIAVYLGLGVLANLPSWTGGVTHTMQCGGCGDSGQEVWFLGWAAHALTHLQDPLRTAWINYPWGVDLADNTSMPLAGIIGTPITLLFGPVATFNVLFSLAFAGSASAAFLLLRRFTTWMPAAFVGGLLYGFSPYMVGQGEGHLFLLLVPVPPLVLLLMHETVVRQRWRWWLAGLALGLLMIVQLGWSAELLACTVTVALIGVVVLAIARPRLVRARFGYAFKAIALGFVVLAPFALWFAVVTRTGPEHLSGPVHPVALLAGLSTDLGGIVVPSVNQHFSLGLAQTGTSFLGLTEAHHPPIVDPAENGSYIGIPILLLLLVGLYRFRRDGLVLFSILMAALALVLSMGSHLHVWGHDTGVPLPFDVFTKLPFVESEVASRYCLFMWLFIAMAVGAILDRARASTNSGRGRHRQGGPRRRGPLPLMAVLALLGIVSLVPGWPYNIGQVYTPSALVRPTVDTGPVGSTLLTYPLARGAHNLPMVWQALDGFAYRMPAGEAAVANAHEGDMEGAFNSCWSDPHESVPRRILVAPARGAFLRWQVRTVVIPLSHSINPLCAVRFVQEVLGRPPAIERGAAVWTDVHA
jgi:hypothetical protein